MKKYFILLLTVFIVSCAAQAELMAANKLIPNLSSQLVEFQTQCAANCKIVFPNSLPQRKEIKQYFLSFERIKSPAREGYLIYIESTKNCHGVKYCNLGVVQVTNEDKPQMYRNIDNKVITQKVKLGDHVTGYFTPSHAIGDYWPAMMEWKKGKLLYHLSWQFQQGQNEKQLIMNMVNSLPLRYR